MGKKVHRKRQQELLQKSLYDDDEEDQKRSKPTANTKTRPLEHETSEVEEDVRRWKDQEDDKDDDDGPSTALPILTRLGRWKASKREQHPSIVREDTDVKPSSTCQAGDSGSEDESTMADNGKSLEEVKETLGLLAITITEDPEDNVGKIREMLKFTDRSKQSPDIVRLALISSLAVIKDILPGYYIRPLKEAEKNSSVSKDIKHIRVFEESILSSYLRFFEILKGIIHPARPRKVSKRQLPVLHIALSCVHELMLFASHFNHFEEILKLAAYTLTLPWEAEVERTSLAFRRLFEVDESGQVTMLAVRLLSNMIRDLDYDCPTPWITALETVRIKAEQGQRSLKNLKQDIKRPKKHMSVREQKEWKVKHDELAKLAEAEGIVTREELNAWNTETLKFLFRIYFGILKHNPSAEVLPSVLAGLAKHAHRIGIEYFADLLHSLRRLMQTDGKEEGGELDIIPALHCILTVDRIYSINENLASMDLKFFYNSLFRQLGRLIKTPPTSTWDQLQKPLQSCLANLFHPKRHLPALRSASFVQRLADLAMSLATTGMMGPAVFATEHIRHILTHQERARAVLDREPFGQGAYLTTCDDPDLCNPFSRSLYDVLGALRLREQQPRGKLRTLVDEILKLTPQ